MDATAEACVAVKLQLACFERLGAPGWGALEAVATHRTSQAVRGLLDLVANPKLDPSPLIVKTPIDRLSILPVGRERERSAELFSTKEMTRLIQSLGLRYADRLLVLDRRVLAVGTPAEVVESGAYASIREHTHTHGHARTA